MTILQNTRTDKLTQTCYFSNRFSRERPRFIDNLDVIKFLCKDLWTILFKKQIDNLKTNHRVNPVPFSASPLPCPSKPFKPKQKVQSLTLYQKQGVYVLTDNTFRPFLRMSLHNSAEAAARAQPVSPTSIPPKPLRFSPLHPQPSPLYLFTQTAPPLPLWPNPRRPLQHGHNHHRPSRDNRSPSSNIPDQDHQRRQQ